uniref:TSA: Wollemia nobilis Ref_Wollemi_Transcript_29843_741 transcribed RNA sequence n=1 Tax=Wollemia nobilis TaxID=56998 RepID=A0A0C9RFS9_9CONI
MKGQGSYAPPGYIPAPESDDDIHEVLSTSTYHTPQGPSPWSSGICACCDDMQSCWIGLFCPCILFGKNVEYLEGQSWTGPCVVHFLLWGVVTGMCCSLTEGTLLGLLGSFVSCYACGYRRAIRTKYNLEEAPCGDFVTHLFCHMCAICQEYREIRDRSDGFNLSVLTAPSVQTMEAFPEN